MAGTTLSQRAASDNGVTAVILGVAMAALRTPVAVPGLIVGHGGDTKIHSGNGSSSTNHRDLVETRKTGIPLVCLYNTSPKQQL